MPKNLERKRGGVIRYRTMEVGKCGYRTIAVVKQSGPRGGTTIAGPVRRKKGCS